MRCTISDFDRVSNSGTSVNSAAGDAGVDQVIFAAQTGPNRHDHIMESLELFGREVLPEFLDRQENAERDKRRRLERAIEQAMARRPSDTFPDVGDYAVEAGTSL